jgi:hypothetical protein
MLFRVVLKQRLFWNNKVSFRAGLGDKGAERRGWRRTTEMVARWDVEVRGCGRERERERDRGRGIRRMAGMTSTCYDATSYRVGVE